MIFGASAPISIDEPLLINSLRIKFKREINEIRVMYAFNKGLKKQTTIVICCVTSLLFVRCESGSDSKTTPVKQVSVITATKQAITTHQDYPAVIEGANNVEIRPQISGMLQQVFVDEGSYVSAGQLLFKIDERPFREALKKAVAGLHAAEAAQNSARLEVEKLIPLVANKVVSEYQLKTAKAAVQMADANAEGERANVSSAQINLNYTAITAPVSGYIGRLQKKAGSLVSVVDAEALTQLSDVLYVRAYFSLSEKDFASFKNQYPGGTIVEKLKNVPSVTLLLSDDDEYPVKGALDMVSGQFDKSTGAITLRATFSNESGLLRSGNTGKIRLSLVDTDALAVPAAATFEMQDKTFVFTVADGNKLKRKPITVSGKSGTDYLISDGIKSGDRIVINGLDQLRENEVVQPEPASAGKKE